ncbi:mxaJ protein [Methylobacterium sp. UNC378MF]|uniref:substrate-binding domain-containing protein n=1 Tax=Methylobacterium sp. UNC378MF TaxID=1502748 RepID=UPI000886DAE3|nr:substrate-binding domain-containing protein [Methylobacterium sp. UNC378MF]SDA15482.1 mxaJ protein [Methylobacterium sp. UNC378MF]
MSSVCRNGLLALALLSAPGAEGRELRICADPNNLPFSNQAGEGFENRISAIVAADLGATLTYTWWAQRRGFLRNTLHAGLCDVVPGLPVGTELARPTAPLYRSGYAFVQRPDAPPISSFDDPRLKDLRIGVQMVGNDGYNTPPAHALSRRGIVQNVRGYALYGDYSTPHPPSRIVEAVAQGEIDTAVVWGPLAGYFAARQSPPLQVTLVNPPFDGARLPLAFDIAFAVRRDDDAGAFAREVGGALRRHRAEIDAILASYGVPRLDTPTTLETR